MIPFIMDVEDVQGETIRRLTRHRGRITPRVYREAHAEWLRQRRLVAHDSSASVHMYVNRGRWVADCPECRAGVSTGRRWTEARCFGCGAVYAGPQVVWPPDFDALERALLERFPVNRNTVPGETLGQVVADNWAHGVGQAGDLRRVVETVKDRGTRFGA